MVKDSFSDILDGVDLPTDEQVRKETTSANISMGIKSSEAYKQGMANRDQSFREDPTYQAEHKARMQLIKTDPVWQENHRKGLEALRNDPERWAEYQQNYQEGNTAKYDDPAFWEAYYAAIKVRDANPEYHKKRLDASKAKICKKVNAGELGVFDSFVDAARAWEWFGNKGYPNSERVRHRCKSNTFPDWYVIEKGN